MSDIDVAIGVDADCVAYVRGHENAEFRTLEEVARKYDDDPSVYEANGPYV